MQQPPSPTPSEQPGQFPPPPPEQQEQVPAAPSEQPGQFPPPPPNQPSYTPPVGQPGGPPYPGYPPQPARPRSKGNTVLIYGLIFGAILIVSELIRLGVSRAITAMVIDSSFVSLNTVNAANIVVTVVFILISWIIYFLAGFFAGRKSQNVMTATLAGLVATLCFFIAYCIIILVNVVPALSIITRYGNVGSYLLGLVGSIAVTIIVQMGLGVGVSALGGLVGKGTQRQPAQPPRY